jgi:hypothetical protein
VRWFSLQPLSLTSHLRGGRGSPQQLKRSPSLTDADFVTPADVHAAERKRETRKAGGTPASAAFSTPTNAPPGSLLSFDRLAARAVDWLPSPVVESMTSAFLQLVAQNAAAGASPGSRTPREMRDGALLQELMERAHPDANSHRAPMSERSREAAEREQGECLRMVQEEALGLTMQLGAAHGELRAAAAEVSFPG